MTILKMDRMRARIEAVRDLLALLEQPNVAKPYAHHSMSCPGFLVAPTQPPCKCGAELLNKRIGACLDEMRRKA